MFDDEDIDDFMEEKRQSFSDIQSRMPMFEDGSDISEDIKGIVQSGITRSYWGTCPPFS